MSFFLVNTVKPAGVSTDIIGPFDTYALASTYKDTLSYAHEYTVETASTPDLNQIAESLVLNVVILNSTLYVDGTRVAVNTAKIASIRDLKGMIPGLSLKEAKEMVERVKFENGEFFVISEWEYTLLKNPIPVATTACDCSDCTSFAETQI